MTPVFENNLDINYVNISCCFSNGSYTYPCVCSNNILYYVDQGFITLRHTRPSLIVLKNLQHYCVLSNINMVLCELIN